MNTPSKAAISCAIAPRAPRLRVHRTGSGSRGGAEIRSAVLTIPVRRCCTRRRKRAPRATRHSQTALGAWKPLQGWRDRHPSLCRGRRVDPARRACPTFTLTPVWGRRVARDARVQRSVDRNVFRSSRGARNSQECSTLSNRFNLCENRYNPVCAFCRRAKALGYIMRSPPARAIPDYLLKDH